MESDRINRWLALGANIGVLLGILLLVYELRQNHELTRAQMRLDLANTHVALSLSIATDKELADILVKSFGGESLTASERVRHLNLSVANLHYWESMYVQATEGLYDEAAFERMIQGFVWLLNSDPMSHSAYCGNRISLSTDFVSMIDKRLVDLQCNQTQ